jgi:hypothetical protein
VADSSTPKTLGATVLLGLATGALSLSGCAVIGDSDAVIEISAEEQRLFESAIKESDPVLVERYLRRYPDGRVRSLLSAQTPEVLGRLSPSAFADVKDSTLRQLPRSVQVGLPPRVINRIAKDEGADSARDDRSSNTPDDTYSG